MKDKKSKIENLEMLNVSTFDEGMDIFGEHKSREQVRAEEKERQKAEREALRREMEHRRKMAKENGTVHAKRKDIIVVSAVLAGIILLALLALGNSFRRAKEEQQWLINDLRGHYINADPTASFSTEGPQFEVAEMYFTQNNHLCIEMIISNGTDKVHEIAAIEMEVYDDETGELIAGGRAEIAETVLLEVAGTTPYTFYIAPEHILVSDDATLPATMRCDGSIDSYVVESE